MKLLTQEILNKLPALYATEKLPNDQKKIIVKFFHPLSDWTWYATEYDPEEQVFFGLVRGFESELGYFSLADLQEVKVHGLGIERDMYFGYEHTIAEAMRKRI